MNLLNKVRPFCAPDRLAFWTLLASGTYVVLLSSAVFMIRRLSFWVEILLYALPWLLLWPAYRWRVITDPARRREIVLMLIILILGTVNVIAGDHPYNSYKTMRYFLSAGILSLWASMFLLADPGRREVFDWFCCICLAIFAPLAIITYLPSRQELFWLRNVFNLHSIPVGTMVILLAAGPLSLLVSESSKQKIAAWLLISVGLILILLTHKRGTFLAVAAMILVWLTYRLPKLGYLVAAACLAVLLLFTYQGLNASRSLAPDHPSRVSKLHRLELYPFALHVYKKHPWMGIGLRPQTHEKYLGDYQQQHPEVTKFAAEVKSLQTFDNMLVTAFVELGTLMTLTYLGLIIFIIINYCRQVRPFADSQGRDFFRLLPLVGLAVHSLTYDSLLVHPVNWLFHVQLGILAGFWASD